MSARQNAKHAAEAAAQSSFWFANFVMVSEAIVSA
jgi:hypothetical protein